MSTQPNLCDIITYNKNSHFSNNSQILCKLDRDSLYKKYIVEGKSCSQIAKQFNLDPTTIWKRLKKLSIPMRTNSQSKIGNKNHIWKGGLTLDKDGYVLVRKPDHPHANKNGYVRRSHLVMEQIIGRYLKVGETTHHKNKQVADDRPENLKLFKSQSKHLSFHHKEIKSKY